MNPPTSPSLPLVIACLLASLTLSLLGAVEVGKIPYLGYNRVGDEVQGVVPAGPADLAGFENGDRLVSIAGAALDDPAAMAGIARPDVGSPRDYVLERGGSEIRARLAPTPLPGDQLLGLRINSLVGLTFLVCGFLAYVRAGGKTGLILALLGSALAPTMANPPFRSFGATMAPVLGWLWPVLGLASVVLFLHFVLLIPRRHGWLERLSVRVGMYVALAAVAVAIALRLPVPVFWLQLACLLLAVGVLITRYRAASGLERGRGLATLLKLSALGLTPFVAVGVLSKTGVITNPFISQLGSFPLALVPVAMLLATLKNREPATARKTPLREA